MIKKIKEFLHYNTVHWITKDRLISQQNMKLRKVIKHAYETTLFYRKHLDKAGVKPEQIKSANDLNRIPPISKVNVQEQYDDFISKKYPVERCHVRTTSGSSGKILRVLWDEENYWLRFYLYYRMASMVGYSPFKKLVYFLPTPENPGFRFGLFRQLPLPVGLPFETVRERLIAYKPHVLSIYPSYAIDLGNHLSDHDVNQIGIEAISLNSEMALAHEMARIEEKFKCPVYSEYSSVEFGPIAGMCKQKKMHLFSDNVILEILDERGNPLPSGETGEVVLTSLNSYAMSFIRYRIGDFSSLVQGDCPCGSPFPLLGPIEGRRDDSFILKDGRVVPAWKIYEIVERPLEEYGMDKLVLSDFFLVQKAPDRADFFYVKGPDFHEDYPDKLSAGSRKLFGEDFHLNIVSTSDISRVKHVKRKYIHCEVLDKTPERQDG